MKFLVALILLSTFSLAQTQFESLNSGCNRSTVTVYRGEAFFDSEMKLIRTKFSGSSVLCLGDSRLGGQYQLQYGGRSPCPEGKIFRTSGLHFVDGKVAGELYASCLSLEDYEALD